MNNTLSSNAQRLRLQAERLPVMRKVVLRLMPLITMSYFFAYFDRINIAFAKTPLQTDLGISNTAYGLGASLLTIGYVLLEVPSNLVLYRVGTRKWITRIMITWGLATAAMVFVTTEWQFYALRFFIGAAEAGFAPGILYYMTIWFPTSYRGRAMSYFFLAQAFSGAVGAPVAGLILTYMNGVGGHPGWHWLFLIGGLPCVLLGLIVFKRLDNKIEDATWLSEEEKRQLVAVIARAPQAEKGKSFLGAIRTPGFVTLVLVNFMLMFSYNGLNYWAPDLIKTAGGGSDLLVGILTAVPYACAAVAMVLMGRRSDATGERRFYSMLCFGAACIGFICAAIFADNVVLLVMAFAVIGASLIGGIPMFWAMPPKLLTGAGAAVGIALINTLGHIGGIVSPIMVGYIKDTTGSATPALYIIAAVCLSAVIALRFFSPNLLSEIDRNPTATPTQLPSP